MNHSPYHHAYTHINQLFSLESFQKYFINSKTHFSQLSKLIKESNLDNVHCRFNVWRLCLGVVNVNADQLQKRTQLQESRIKYQEKKQQALKSYGKKSPNKQPFKKNPLLMMGPIKPQQHKQTETDQFLKQQIHKDVERTYQEMKFFQEKAIIKLLDLLLFVWCRRNPEVSYKQGMNQLLASVVVCYFREAEFRKMEDKPEHVDEKLWESHIFFNSVEHIESDIFSVFQKIIDIQSDMYKTEADLTLKSKVNPNSKNNTPILQRIIQIKDHKLKHMDLELFRILKLQDVQTKSFMLRWIRCMHTREFDLENSFVIWDSIFLEFLESENSKKNRQFQFIDAMCLAMFMYMRSIVFTKQTAGQILQVYQKYPQLKRGAYLQQLITLAWTICEQLALQNQNSQPSQSNWFEESQKIKALHFMQKKQQKKHIQSQVKVVPPQAKKKQHHVEKQLKEKDHAYHLESVKRNPQHSHYSQTVKPKAQNHSGYTVKQLSVEKKEQEDNIHQSTAKIQKNRSKELGKDKQEQVILRQAFVEHHDQKYKVPENTTISLSEGQITEILQNLNQSLTKIRDIDAQSLIRRTIKKIQSKVKQFKDNFYKQYPTGYQHPDLQ